MCYVHAKNYLCPDNYLQVANFLNNNRKKYDVQGRGGGGAERSSFGLHCIPCSTMTLTGAWMVLGDVIDIQNYIPSFFKKKKLKLGGWRRRHIVRKIMMKMCCLVFIRGPKSYAAATAAAAGVSLL